jgi:carbamoyl-phosphate synthase large subunit
VIKDISAQTEKLARALKVVGLMNIQFAVKNGDVYILEVNPRASRTVPFVAKATGIPIAKIAARVMTGEKLSTFKLKSFLADGKQPKHVAIKEAVFPFARFPGVDIILGPEMKSTGEAMGIDADFDRAFAKSQLGGGTRVPVSGTAFISVKECDKAAMVEPGRQLIALGFKLIATSGTAEVLRNAGLECSIVNKVLEGRPHIVDAMKNGEIQLVFNTTEGAEAIRDSFDLRRNALTHKIPYYTTVAGALAATLGIAALKAGDLEVRPLQSYFPDSL